MRTGRLEILKIAGLTVEEFIDKSQDASKCMLCDYEFRIGDDMLDHAIKRHDEWVHWKLLDNMVTRGKLKCIVDNNYLNPVAIQIQDILKPYNPFGDKEEKGEPNSPVYQDRMFQAPRCKKCHHNDPEYDVVSSPPHKNGIKLKCVYCGNISVKD